MKKSINFQVFGKIVQWQRVKSRYNPVSKKIISNNKPDLIIYQNLIKEAYKNKCDGTPYFFGTGVPLHISVTAYFMIPKSMPKKYQKLLEQGQKIRRLRTPDDDNLVKNVTDALNKVAYGDDKQVSVSSISFWTLGAEHIDVEIYEEDYVAW